MAKATSAAESTNLNPLSSAATEQNDSKISRAESKNQAGVEGGADRGNEWTSKQAEDEQARVHTTGSSEPSPAKRQKTDSEEVSERSDAVESINEGWQDVGAASGVLEVGRKDEGGIVIRGVEGENGEAEEEKRVSVLPVLSENKDTYEDAQRRIAEARERRAAATAGQPDATNRLGRDW